MSGLQPLIGFVLPPPQMAAEPPNVLVSSASKYFEVLFRYLEVITNSIMFLEEPIGPPSGPGGSQPP